ncbi:hypothetical protein BC938DRAFT_470571 [Jimgerdemannia flammicorona]|uniref:Uncharacterized protein n=1 Tax=Jimgerdemannia flammicorona TaxID=994334 RepID=A0A433QV94_9FUNG|nr:hypothetical protein BC938DRAFT_470571 [Jimgerdemannia flammicorona]
MPRTTKYTQTYLNTAPPFVSYLYLSWDTIDIKTKGYAAKHKIPPMAPYRPCLPPRRPLHSRMDRQGRRNDPSALEKDMELPKAISTKS